MAQQHQFSPELDLATDEALEHQIILFNDEVNTFDHVINTLVKVCRHDLLQAEQCALLVHFKGKCAVKSGSYSDLLPQCSALLDAGLSAEIN
ncbi:MAG: ATP-dependent Clp protease adaptor ClpS [Flavobacteriaceae bacterium]|jgi:ATP-dependent Clp protease adaptor protein ClpS|nr:ATP-dependent Clp protease adaptor ClpS [Flavobacteriaceae bacterium]